MLNLVNVICLSVYLHIIMRKATFEWVTKQKTPSKNNCSRGFFGIFVDLLSVKRNHSLKVPNANAAPFQDFERTKQLLRNFPHTGKPYLDETSCDLLEVLSQRDVICWAPIVIYCNFSRVVSPYRPRALADSCKKNMAGKLFFSRQKRVPMYRTYVL